MARRRARPHDRGVSLTSLVVFFVVLIGVLTLIATFVYRRAVHAFALGPVARRALVGALVAAAIATPLSRFGAGRLGSGIAAWLGLGAGVLSLGLMLSFGLLVVVSLAGAPWKLAGRWRTWNAQRSAIRNATSSGTPTPSSAMVPAIHAETASATDELSAVDAGTLASAAVSLAPATSVASLSASEPIPRRVFLERAATGSALLLGGGSAVYGAFVGRRDYRIETVPVRIAGLPRTLDGFTIAQISDIHFGLYVRDDEVRIAADLIRRTRPDLIVLTGDLVDHDPGCAPFLGRLLQRLEGAARHGIAVIPGNHDYYTGVETVLDTARRAGASVLVNEGRVIGDAGGAFALLGVDDVWMRREGGGPDLARAIAMVPRALPRVLLCHNPSFFPEAADHVALQLSGHTHGGQVNLSQTVTGLVLPHGYVAGLYPRGDAQLYVNRGFGTAGPPSRVFSPPEITRLVLVAG
jgi:predicted MPP superfamily phosphohydrolase